MIQDQSQSSFGLAPNVAAGLASFFTLIGGIVILLGKPPQQWVRFVAVQAIVMSVAYIVFEIALSVISVMLAVAHLGVISIFLGLLNLVVGLIYFIMWIVMTIKAFTGSAQRYPVISDWADRYVPASTSIG